MPEAFPSPRRILIIGPSWVGDMIMAQSLFTVLKNRFPATQIDVMAPAWCKALLERMPQVTHTIEMPLGHGALQLGTRYHLGKFLRDRHYDQAIILPNSFKSALIPFWAHIAQRTGYTGEMRYGLLNDRRTLDRNVLSMTVQRFVALAYSAQQMLLLQNISMDNVPFPSLAIDQAAVATALKVLQLNDSRPILSLCPGAEYGPAKQWPARHFAALAREKLARGWQVWIFGSERDDVIAADILNELTQQQSASAPTELVVNLCGKTTLAQAIDLMSLSRAAVSNDSGLMHMAAALKVPVVGIYGSTDPSFTPPLGSNTAVARLGLSCSPCFKRTCPLGHTDCLQMLKPKQVLDHLDKLLSETKH